MVKVGYKPSSEEQTPSDLARHARLAGKSGFSFALISGYDHVAVHQVGRDQQGFFDFDTREVLHLGDRRAAA